MNVMIDTNIFLDVLLEREPFADDSAKVLTLCEERKINGFVSASYVTDIFYIVRKYTHSTETAYNALGKILDIVKICSVTNADVISAYTVKAKDFEDCLLATCAQNMKCDYLITRNKSDFADFGISLLEPKELLELSLRN